MDTKHTPTPWAMTGPSIGGSPIDDGGDFAIYAKNDETRHIIAEAFHRTGKNDLAPVEANAAFIVRACNAHDDLLRACEAVMVAPGLEHLSTVSITDMLQAAIAKAKKGTSETYQLTNKM